MNAKTWAQFDDIRSSLKRSTDFFRSIDPRLIPVYNTDLDRFGPHDTIRYILVGDNPGKKELIEQRYLVGTAGRQARNFFHNHGLVEDFDSQVLVLNKTFLHTPATGDLRAFMREGSLREQLLGSQRYMAYHIFLFHKLLQCPLWIVGCGEMARGRIFANFLEKLENFYLVKGRASLRDKIFCYKHFSYGNFSRDLDLKNDPPDVMERLDRVGRDMRQQVFGW